MTGQLTYRYVALTDVGLRRTNNEDSGYASSRLIAIADGMGGAAAGDLASATTMNTLRTLDRDHEIDALSALGSTIELANTRLSNLIADDPAVEGMGTTVEAMLWDGEKLAWAHLGDSRSYRLRDGALTQISSDHTFVQSLVDEGRLTAEEARHHPHKSLLLRALLGRDDNAADLTWIQPQAGDRYLLCSDGLSDMVTDDVIERCLGADSIDLAATELIRAALDAGGVDNVTVVIAEFVPKDTEVDPTLSSADGRPQLVGAAAEQPRPPTGMAVDAEQDPDEGIDEEELRYAPLPPAQRRWFKRTLVVLVLLALIGAGGYAGYRWTQTQYYVGAEDGHVAIYRGVDLSLPFVSLNTVVETTEIEVDSLPTLTQERVNDGIPSRDRAEADETVANLRQTARNRMQPTPTPTPTPSPESTATSGTDDTTAQSR